ncbi:MAG: hypothetical protein ABI253_13515 [Mycobacterium sp.]
MFTEQGLDRLRLLHDRGDIQGRRGVAQPFGGFANPVQGVIFSGAADPGGLSSLLHPPVGGIDGVGVGRRPGSVVDQRVEVSG